MTRAVGAWRVAGVVLAAGRSSRVGSPKALATLAGETLAARVGRTLREAGCERVLYVVAHPHEALLRVALPRERLVTNPSPEAGMLSSLGAALDALLRGADAVPDAVVVALVDHPRVAPATIRALVDRGRETGAGVVRPVHEGRGGHPFVLARGELSRVLALTGPDGAGATLRDALRGAARAEALRVDDPFVLEDLDDPASLKGAGVALLRGRAARRR